MSRVPPAVGFFIAPALLALTAEDPTDAG